MNNLVVNYIHTFLKQNAINLDYTNLKRVLHVGHDIALCNVLAQFTYANLQFSLRFDPHPATIRYSVLVPSNSDDPDVWFNVISYLGDDEYIALEIIDELPF
jgi:hypothetical protein